MTIDELIEEAAKIPGWYLDANKKIRCVVGGVCCCPITAVAVNRGRRFGIGFWDKAAVYLDLCQDDFVNAEKIVEAADGETILIGPKRLRQKMLKALKLETMK